jgi:hypothetical protein
MPHVKAAAKGKITTAQLKQKAQALGVSPDLALEAAAVAKVADMAEAGDPKAQAALNVAAEITSGDVKELARAENTIGQLAVVHAAAEGDTRAFLVTTPDGQVFKTLVVPQTA